MVGHVSNVYYGGCAHLCPRPCRSRQWRPGPSPARPSIPRPTRRIHSPAAPGCTAPPTDGSAGLEKRETGNKYIYRERYRNIDDRHTRGGVTQKTRTHQGHTVGFCGAYQAVPRRLERRQLSWQQWWQCRGPPPPPRPPHTAHAHGLPQTSKRRRRHVSWFSTLPCAFFHPMMTCLYNTYIYIYFTHIYIYIDRYMYAHLWHRPRHRRPEL